MADKIATREAYGDALAEFAAKYDKLVVLDADLAEATKTITFKAATPKTIFGETITNTAYIKDGNTIIDTSNEVTTTVNEVSVNNTINIKSTIQGSDVVKMYRNSTQYYAKFLDDNGNALKNTKITYNINGVFYTRKTNDNGTTSIALKLGTGVYNATVTVDNKSINSVVTILSTSSGNDITKVSKNGTRIPANYFL